MYPDRDISRNKQATNRKPQCNARDRVLIIWLQLPGDLFNRITKAMPKVAKKDATLKCARRSQRVTHGGKKPKKRCAASDAIVDLKDTGGGKITLTMADGWEDVLPKKGEDDPGVLIMWDCKNLEATVASFNRAGAVPAAPAFLGPPPFTVPGLQAALLTHMQVTGGGGGVVGNVLKLLQTLWVNIPMSALLHTLLVLSLFLWLMRLPQLAAFIF
jgi:hypothetical protein